MHIFEPLVKDSTASNFSGTGDVITQGAGTGYQSVAAIGSVGDQFGYMIRKEGNAQWEEGLATKTSTGFTRSPRKGSSGAATLVNFAAGQYDVMLTPTSSLANRYFNSTSPKMVFASAYATSDADISMTSTTYGADQTAKLQAMFDLAANGPLLIIWDIVCGVTSVSGTEALRVRSNTTVRALPGCGAIMRTNQPTPMFRNYNPTITPGNRVDHDITFDGGIWNGNRANQSVKETSANGGIFLFDFLGVDNLNMIGGIEFRKAKAFSWRAANCYHILLDHYRVDFGDGNSDVNTDGIHFNGPCSYITMTNGELFNCADDAIAFNADDGWGAGGMYGPYGGVYGEISDVRVDGVFLRGYSCGIRMLSGGSRMDRFKFSNIRGTTSGYWLVIDNFNPSQTIATGPGNIGSVEVDGVYVDSTVTEWPQMQAHINCKVEQISLNNITKGKFLNVLYPAIRIGEKANLGQLVVQGYKSYPFNSGTYLSDQILVVAGAVVGTMRVNEAVFDAPSGTGGYPINIQSGASVSRLMLNGNSGSGFTDFVTAAGTVGNSHIPATNNFMDGGGASVSTWTLDAGYTETSASGVTFSVNEPGVQVARKTAVDTFSGNIQLSSTIQFTGTVSGAALNGSLIVRGSNLQPYGGSTRSAYVMDIDKVNGRITLQRSDSSGDTIIGARVTASGGIAIGTSYKATITAKGSAISCSFQRLSDNLYLQTDGSWSATAANCSSGTDTTYGSGTGLQYGVYGYNQNTSSASIVYTNFTAIAAP